MNKKRMLVVGAGFSGCIVARKLAELDVKVTVIDSRSHIGGNCYTERDEDTGVMEHIYGPHIFHTDNERVWDFVNQYAKFMPYVNRVKTTVGNSVYSLPINLHTINQFYNTNMGPAEARKFINEIGEDIDEPESFEEQGLRFVGRDLYEAFFKGYTQKQWGVEPAELPASILKRLPVRFDYNDNYFSHKYQGIPENGYTPIFEKLLDHENIDLVLGQKYTKEASLEYDHVIYTGPIDRYYDYKFGKLSYRTLEFVREVKEENDFQGCAVMNYGSVEVPYTRKTEHKHFSPWEVNDRGTVVYTEYSKSCGELDEPYYPVRLSEDKSRLKKYLELIDNDDGVSFIGRLATYRYLDMDVVINEALGASEEIIDCIKERKMIPTRFHEDSL